MRWAVALLFCLGTILVLALAGAVRQAQARAEIAEIHLADCQAAAAAQVYP